MKKESPNSIPVDGIFHTQHLVVVSYKIKSDSRTVLKRIYHGIGRIRQSGLVDITYISKEIEVYGKMYFAELFCIDKRNCKC